jgi:hypothetical protein
LRFVSVALDFSNRLDVLLQVNALSDKHVLAVSERSAAVWEYTADETPRAKVRRSYAPRTASHTHGEAERWATGAADSGPHETSAGAVTGTQKDYYYQSGAGTGATMGARECPTKEKDASMLMGLGDAGEVKKVLNIKNMPDSAFSASTLMLPALEVRGSSGMNGMNMGQDKGLGGSSKPQYVLYCVAGHKLYAGTLPSYDKHNRELIHMGNNAIVDVRTILSYAHWSSLCTCLSACTCTLSFLSYLFYNSAWVV